MDIDSHNAQQAKILWDYFSIISNEDDIDIEEMYQLFVLGWNSELSEDHIFNRDFSGCTAQMFVLIMDSLDVLLGKKQIDDGSLLLNDDLNIWYLLGNSWCWGDLRPQVHKIPLAN